MAKKEVTTDLWVYDLLKEAKINDKFSAQGSNIKEIHKALQTASKRGTGNVEFPEYVGVVKNFLIVIEDKADTHKHINLTNKDINKFNTQYPTLTEKTNTDFHDRFFCY